ncbi:MAG: glycoside hydrolase family 25 protein [Alloprevotella sp.]|nr:glycoside hydrolase family 25 protein [Alloprevotella sp.]
MKEQKTKRKLRTKHVVQKHRGQRLSGEVERLRRQTRRRAMWIGAAIAAVAYAFVFYYFIVSPYTLRWKALYGDLSAPEGYSIRGIDVSHHQGRIDWAQLREGRIGEEPVRFVFIKATEGTSLTDAEFKRNFRSAREQGMTRGAYHFFNPYADAAEQARHFIANVKLEPGDLPPVLDIENAGNLNKNEVRKAALTWLQTVEKHYGVRPILYTYHKFKQQYLDGADFKPYHYWIAHYYVSRLEYKGEWKFWQHTDTGHLPGITGEVDFNVYNGSMYDLRRLTVRE